jgi:hypothetical protein
LQITSGSSLSLESKLKTTKRRGFANLWTLERNLQQILSLHLVGLQRIRRKEKRERHGLGSSWLNSNLYASLFGKSLKTHHLGFPRFPDMINKLWPKFGDF